MRGPMASKGIGVMVPPTGMCFARGIALPRGSKTFARRTSLSPVPALPKRSPTPTTTTSSSSTRRRRLVRGKEHKERGNVKVSSSVYSHEAENIADLAGILSQLRGVDASSSIQLVYVGALLGLLSGAVFLVVRQVLFRTQLEEATKELSEKARTGDATYDEYYELGVLLIRKKLYATALKHLDSAKRSWEGDEDGLSQLYNAMGYAYLQQEKLESAIEEYKGAIELRPNYIVALNNLGDAYKKTKDYENALQAYTTALNVDPSNKVS